MDTGAFTQLFATLGIITATSVTTYSIAKNKGYEAQREALESWKANAEAKAEELKIERTKNDSLRNDLETARTDIASLKAQVIKLEGRPDMSQAISEWRQFEKRDNERIESLAKTITNAVSDSLDKHSVILASILELVKTAVEDGDKGRQGVK